MKGANMAVRTICRGKATGSWTALAILAGIVLAMAQATLFYQIWPYFEKIGARIVGMWVVIPPPGGKEASPDYDEVYLTTRYASLDHWAATRDAAAMGGDGPDYAALQAALAVRQSLTIETKVTFLQGVVGPLPPVFMLVTGVIAERTAVIASSSLRVRMSPWASRIVSRSVVPERGKPIMKTGI